MQTESKDSMEVEHHLFCILNLFNFKFQNYGELRVEFAQTTIEEEGVFKESDVVWLNQRFCQSSLKLSISSFCMMDCRMLCNV
jgi:hypothetical protein